MKIRSFTLLVAFALCFVTMLHAQPKSYDINNGFGIGGGITQFDISTDNFNTKPGTGWMIQASATADLPHKWYNISYNIQLAQNKLEISGRMADDVAETQPINYEIFTAQLGLVIHVKLIKSFVTLDLGPQIQYNGQLELENDGQEGYFINGFDLLRTEDIRKISQVNVNGMAGLTAGFGPVKVRAQYMYGVTNMLNKLNDQQLNVPNGNEFKGNMSMWAFTALFTF